MLGLKVKFLKVELDPEFVEAEAEVAFAVAEVAFVVAKVEIAVVEIFMVNLNHHQMSLFLL